VELKSLAKTLKLGLMLESYTTICPKPKYLPLKGLQPPNTSRGRGDHPRIALEMILIKLKMAIGFYTFGMLPKTRPSHFGCRNLVSPHAPDDIKLTMTISKFHL